MQFDILMLSWSKQTTVFIKLNIFLLVYCDVIFSKK